MSTLKEINLRITSLKNTKKITQAMKLIAVTKLNRAQSNVKRAMRYYASLNEVYDDFRNEDVFQDHYLIKARDKASQAKVVIFTSDKGLCGPFNNNLIKKAAGFISNLKDRNLKVKTEHFGKKGYDFFKKQNIVEKWHEDVFREKFDFSNATKLIEQNISHFLKNQIDEFYIIYNRFDSVLKQTPVIKQVIPLVIEKENENRKVANFLYEPDQEAVLDQVVKKMICFELYFAYLNTVAGENSARMTAMDSATNNCNDMIDRFTLTRNQLRQANITKELIEIISGAESV